MDWLIILGKITAVITIYAQLSSGVKNTIDIYYKIKEEREKSRSRQEDDSE
ncbi:hypothetical protein ACRS52_06375 [Bacillus cytotoxicus]|uniref:Uncharacterized protein n=1 Tax=Bacillus cytotoxicus TaxID=580165 RepID=A0AAX2CNP7_9BACI|nr:MULTISPECIES: hypothetical protein [Bacillus cereus group]QTR81182.1 hypothetical protein JC777_00665 [Bacillus cytotoxicus]SCM08104.1 Uncharacterized protein BCB44BAC_04534 [Bacillus cytotoxicus]